MWVLSLIHLQFPCPFHPQATLLPIIMMASYSSSSYEPSSYEPSSSDMPSHSSQVGEDEGLEALLDGDEESDDDLLSNWRKNEGFEEMPDYPTPWPLENDHPLVTSNYSITNRATTSTTDTSTYKKQIVAMEKIMKDRPASVQCRPSCKKPKMSPYEVESIRSRKGVADSFVGFCHHVMELEPTMEHMMDSIVIAKYWGWHIARGTDVR